MKKKTEAAQAAEEAKTEAGRAETRFTKAALLKCKRFADSRDILAAFLTDGAEYTIAETENLIKNWNTKGKVN